MPVNFAGIYAGVYYISVECCVKFPSLTDGKLYPLLKKKSLPFIVYLG
jgi:hypothetical protein